MVGEYARAFSGTQLRHLAPLLQQHQVQLWLPETDGPVDAHDVAHQALLLMLGAQAKREVQQARFRTTMAMQAQAREQRRYPGGRPPYGYRLVDAGPHPNQYMPSGADACTGWNLTRTPPHTSHGSSSNGWPGIASPASPAPSTTGQHPAQDALPGVVPVRRLTAATQWAVSTKPSHPALVSDHYFITTQAISSRARPADGATHMESQWSHGNPCYRCRHGHITAYLPGVRSARNLHLREDVTLARIRAELGHLANVHPRGQSFAETAMTDHSLRLSDTATGALVDRPWVGHSDLVCAPPPQWPHAACCPYHPVQQVR